MAQNIAARYIIRRVVSFGFITLALVVLTFGLVHFIPGDPARRIAGSEASAEQVLSIRERLGLTDPLLVQFKEYMTGLVTLDLGRSFVTNEDVANLVLKRFSATFMLGIIAIVGSIVFAIIFGYVIAYISRLSTNSIGDTVFSASVGAVAAIPGFLAATFLVYIFSLKLGLFPISASVNKPISMVLPIAAVMAAPTAILLRVVRLEVISLFNADFIRVAKSRGIRNMALFVRHIGPNILTSVLTLGGLTFGAILGSTVVVENVFGFSGIGPLLVSSVAKHDYPVIQASILLIGATIVLINAVVDAAIMIIDRRSLVGSL